MEGDCASEHSDATSSSDPATFSFVTATSLSDFKNPDTMRQVRRAVMHTYLNKAGNDPTSTDVRVTRKRRAKKTSPVRSGDRSEPLAIPAPSSSIGSFASDLQSESRVSDDFHGMHDGSAAFSTQSNLSRPEVEGPYSMPPSILAHMEPLIQVDPASQRRSQSVPQIFGPEAHRPSYDESIPNCTLDLSSVFNPFSQTGLDIEQLKRACTSYFQTANGNFNPTPAEFLAALSKAALASIKRSSPLSSSNRRVTQELLNVLPRILHQSLSNYPQGYSDSNIAAVLQFLNTQLSNNLPAMIPVYQACLKHMVMARGGLDKIGQSGVIPIHVSITDMEANLLQDQPADPMYLTFATRYITQKPPDKPQMMDYSQRTTESGQTEVLSENLASQIVLYSHDLTNALIELIDVEKGAKDGNIPARVAAIRKQELDQNITMLTDDIHRMPHASTPGHESYNDFVYEAIRIACLIMAHAIYHRVPLSRAPTVKCMAGHQIDCSATPELIQAAIKKSGKLDSWGTRASMQYWVFLVASAACHKDDDDDSVDVQHSAPESRRGSVQLHNVNLNQSGSTPQLQALSLQQVHSAPWGSTADYESIAAAQYAPFNTPTSSLPLAYLGPSASTDGLVRPYLQAAPSEIQGNKRLRDEEPSIYPPPASNSSSTRTFLVANAVRCSILLRFEHTSRVVYAILKMGRIRDALAAST